MGVKALLGEDYESEEEMDESESEDSGEESVGEMEIKLKFRTAAEVRNFLKKAFA